MTFPDYSTCTCYLRMLFCIEIIIMTSVVALVTGIIILYIKIYEDDEDYYSYPIQAVDQRGNGRLVYLEIH